MANEAGKERVKDMVVEPEAMSGWIRISVSERALKPVSSLQDPS